MLKRNCAKSKTQTKAGKTSENVFFQENMTEPETGNDVITETRLRIWSKTIQSKDALTCYNNCAVTVSG